MRILALVSVLLLSAAPAAGGGILPDSLFLEGLEAAGLHPDELTCFPESNDEDPFRLPLIRSLMRRPALADSLLPLLREELFADPAEQDPLGAPDLAFLARLGARLHPDLAAKPPLPWEGARIDLLESMGEFPHSPERYFGNLMPVLLDQRRHALRELDADERALLFAESPRLLEQSDAGEAADDPVTLRRLEETEGARIDAALALWARCDRSLLYRAHLRFLRDAIWYARILLLETYANPERRPAALPGRDHEFANARAQGELLHMADTPYGAVAVGGEGTNRYEGEFLFILDLGGDDCYRLASIAPTAVDDPRGFRCLFDLAGDDLWESAAPFALAGAFLGASLLVDEAGDDIYRAADFDLGCGWLGTGILVDRAGDDLYAGGSAVMGAGGGGLGLLRDLTGEDVYRAELYAQGFGWVGGCGVLDERGGGDVYAVAPKHTDILRYEDHSLTLSQGFSIGARPDWSGGIGILRDAAGNDSYLADIYGQGSAYWYALGLLLDEGGNDSYDAYQYAQGAGIHLALGFLLDDGGNDSYSSHGVGQGCGHDLAFGLLRDAAGNDRYSCDDLSQGAGSANGIGMLLDGGGLDGYLTKSDTAPAYGNPRRHFGSVGLLVDGSGEDWFSARGESGERHGSLEGTLLDRDVAIAGPVWNPGEAVPYRAAAWTMNDYFLMASSGEPRFRDWQKAGMDSLTANPEAAIAALIPHFDTDVARRRHRIKDALKTIGAPAVPALRELLREGPSEYRRQAAWCLEEIGDPRAFPDLMALLAEPRDHRDEVSALAALARLNDLGRVQRKLLLRACEKLLAREESHVFVRKEIAYLLGRQELGGHAHLVSLAADPHYAPRWMAREALAERKGWGRALGIEWRRALDTGDLPGALRLSRLLSLRPARELRVRLREAERSSLADAPSLRAALRRALDAHPAGGSLPLAAVGRRFAGR